MSPIVSPEWLNDNLNDPNLIVLDASLEGSADGSLTSERTVMIKGARWFDIKTAFSNTSSPLPNTVPSKEQFEEECQKLGINKHHKIVVYDHFGVYSSPRAWWLFKLMGHESVSVLDGGLTLWIQKGYKVVTTSKTNYKRGDFKSNYQSDLVVLFDDVKENCIVENFLIVDARSQGRFKGTAPEPRAHLKSGHIPNSVNIPYKEVLNGNQFKSTADLKKLFKSKCKSQTSLIFSCGSGLTACIVMLASYLSYSESKKIYDGSWTEWAENTMMFQ